MSVDSPVLLGVVDKEIDYSIETSWFLNKIGGHPDFADNLKGSFRCVLCNATQNLVAQMYCPLDDSKYHRTLYIFCCTKPCCWSKSEGWTVFRQMLIDESDKTLKNNNPEPVSSWGEDCNDWGFDDTFTPSTSSRNSAVSEEDTAALCQEMVGMNVRTSFNVNHSLPPRFEHTYGSSYQSYYINVFDEKDCRPSASNIQLGDLDKTVTSQPDMSTLTGKCQIAAENYEPADYRDKTFHKFLKSTKRFPEQVMRYCYSGSPLLPKNVTVVPTRCSCGSERLFEAQLMPALLPYLKVGDIVVEFSTILIYTCSKNCTVDAGYSLTNEYVFYIDDPDLSYFKGQKGP